MCILASVLISYSNEWVDSFHRISLMQFSGIQIIALGGVEG